MPYFFGGEVRRKTDRKSHALKLLHISVNQISRLSLWPGMPPYVFFYLFVSLPLLCDISVQLWRHGFSVTDFPCTEAERQRLKRRERV